MINALASAIGTHAIGLRIFGTPRIFSLIVSFLELKLIALTFLASPLA